LTHAAGTLDDAGPIQIVSTAARLEAYKRQGLVDLAAETFYVWFPPLRLDAERPTCCETGLRGPFSALAVSARLRQTQRV
jgi:hypothetical protein